MGTYRIIFPDWFDDHAWEVESKGWLQDVAVIFGGKEYPITFYDPVRLSQTIEDDISAGDFFFENNLVVLKSVDRENIELAIRKIVETGRITEFKEKN